MGSGFVSPWHIAIFALVVLLVFGPKKLPELGRSLGKGMREFKDSVSLHTDDAPTEAPAAGVAPGLPAATRPGNGDRDSI